MAMIYNPEWTPSQRVVAEAAYESTAPARKAFKQAVAQADAIRDEALAEARRTRQSTIPIYRQYDKARKRAWDDFQKAQGR